jgi:hypothetical protein
MKLTTIASLLAERYDDFDDEADRRADARRDAEDDAWRDSHSGTFIVEEYDGLQPDDMIVEMFDIEVEYSVEDHGYTDHPYGQGTAREEHGSSVNIESAYTVSEVKCYDPENDEKVIKTFPKHTDVADLPGWGDSDWAYLQKKADDHV